MNGTTTAKVVTESFVKVQILSPSQTTNTVGNEKSFSKSMTIDELKSRLEMFTGVDRSSMQLSVYKEGNKDLICILDNDTALLGSYPVDSGMAIHVTGTTNSVDFGNVTEVPKYVIPDEKYKERTDTARTFLQQHKLGVYSTAANSAERQREEAQLLYYDQMKDKIGARCEVSLKNQAAKRGKLMFIGDVHFKPGIWCGVEYDEPVGKNDGSVNGERYFQCQEKYGGFVQPQFLHLGDYPVEVPDVDEM